MRILTIILVTLLLSSCKSNYVVLGYESPDFAPEQYFYMLQRTTFPKTIKYVKVDKPCPCLCPGDTIKFKRENDSLVPMYYKIWK
jgi:hypothetical protein